MLIMVAFAQSLGIILEIVGVKDAVAEVFEEVAVPTAAARA